ncbi:phage protein D [Salmonella enterica subsp. enterica serovar Poona]|nr:phage protein D [Salmonella enterica subsp. enterica serovar Mikawasima]EBD9815360.1 phage protein D [Salmonella enterica]ECM1813104.1 phage protein D [Salmonella enterica subsp. enterica serovar Newport]EDJ2552622.1 phage protein D [Salmonella enterica subsp. enterica serovar Stanley]EDJ2556980.1 phage protein D [Salmonella enterica subsp. enterica serovar Poona]EDQ2390823.1 phage protein D [Salmonella enterica subsp. enterica]EDV2640195.1 phage protein D [Salmonella enterica subsp. salam
MAAVTGMTAPVPQPAYRLVYNRKDITHDVSVYVTSVSYTDRLSGESDEIQVDLEDSEGRWRDAWYPGKGDTLTLQMGYAGEPLRECGTFSIDEIELSGPPDSVSLRGLATSVTVAMRTKVSRGFENTTLAAIAQRIAGKHRLQLQGQIEPLTLDRVTQYDETDLAFLKRLARDYGYLVKVTHTHVIFSSLDKLRDAPPTFTFTRPDISRYSLRDTINRIYKGAKHRSQNSRTKQVVTYQADGGESTTTVSTATRGKNTSADTLTLSGRSGNQGTAARRTRAALNLKNQYQKVATLSMAGNIRLRAGHNVTLTGFGASDGKWLTGSVRHSMTRSGGYTMDVEVARGPVAKKFPGNGSKTLTVFNADGSTTQTVAPKKGVRP